MCERNGKTSRRQIVARVHRFRFVCERIEEEEVEEAIFFQSMLLSSAVSSISTEYSVFAFIDRPPSSWNEINANPPGINPPSPSRTEVAYSSRVTRHRSHTPFPSD